MNIFHALLVDVYFMAQLVDGLPAYIAPDWNPKAVHFAQKIPLCIAKIKGYCETVLYDAEEDAQMDISIFMHDVRTPLVALKAYSDLVTMYLVPYDPVILLLNEIDYYVNDMRQVISTYDELYRQ